MTPVFGPVLMGVLIAGVAGGRMSMGRRKRRSTSTGQAPVSAAYPHHVWAIDFQANHLEEGTGSKAASIIEGHTRLVLHDTVDVSITGEDLAGHLERLSITHGLPEILRVDNAPELTCRALAQWAKGIVDLAFIPPGEPWKSDYVEPFHSRQRDEFLNTTTLPSLLHARLKLTDWHHEYNHLRRHSCLGHKTPTEYAETTTPAPNPPDSQSDQTKN